MATRCPKCNFENPDMQSFCGGGSTELIASEDFPAQEAQSSLTKILLTLLEDLIKQTLLIDRYEIIEELGRGGMG